MPQACLQFFCCTIKFFSHSIYISLNLNVIESRDLAYLCCKWYNDVA